MNVHCANCGVDYGNIQNFEFRVEESHSGKSFHLVSKESHVHDLNHLLIFDDEVVTLHKEKSMYVVINCKSCGSDVGKKFTKSGSFYLAFGKEKLTYGDVSLKKSDRWSLIESTYPFNSLARYTV